MVPIYPSIMLSSIKCFIKSGQSKEALHSRVSISNSILQIASIANILKTSNLCEHLWYFFDDLRLLFLLRRRVIFFIRVPLLFLDFWRIRDLHIPTICFCFSKGRSIDLLNKLWLHYPQASSPKHFSTHRFASVLNVLWRIISKHIHL